ncbi:YdcF family protein [Bacillus tianshenii]|uniref:YdcF family protein n=1 Tax=Sutcliffiella tianshenii TaxID=1463404 RepID=UPI001CD5932A|nr:YdcF family protein [Bacillus tianshenii]MCA1322349.1 YdcF family protein [Bacillus tianshenii]
MLISELDENALTDHQIASLLFNGLEDDQQTGDCILVVGSSKAVQYRLPKAVELYHNGRAGKILCAGGVKWDGQEAVEAVVLKNEAVKMGVPEKDILVEEISLHTKENVLASLLILDRAFSLHKIDRLLIVTTAFHMKRLHLTLKTYMPSWINFTLCPVNDRTTHADNWFESELGRKRAEAEARKIIMYVKQGALVNEEFIQ